MADQENNRNGTAEVFPAPVKSDKPLTVPHAPNLHTSPHHHDHPVPDAEQRQATSKAALREGKVKSTKPLTVPQGPKLSTSNRTPRTAAEPKPQPKTQPKSPTRKAATPFVPTKPQGPNLSTAARASVRAKADVMGGSPDRDKTRPVASADAENQSPSRVNRGVTVPVGPKFMLDAKYGEKKASASTDPSLTSSANSNRSPVSSQSSSSTSPSKRPLTVPVGPKFMLDKKYGEKSMSAATKTDSP